jgi:Skp family chaperone for outer membrane proteins
MPADAIADLETELKAVKEELEASRKNLKALTNGSSTFHDTRTRIADR